MVDVRMFEEVTKLIMNRQGSFLSSLADFSTNEYSSRNVNVRTIRMDGEGLGKEQTTQGV